MVLVLLKGRRTFEMLLEFGYSHDGVGIGSSVMLIQYSEDSSCS